MDLKMLLYIQNNLQNSFFDLLLPVISFLANYGWIWILSAAILFLYRKYRKYGVALILGLALCFVFGNLTLKPLVGRVRPYEVYNINLLIRELSDFSFPSAHTYVSFCGATVVYNANRKIGVFAFGLAAMIAFSRLYLFVHYPSDVLAGIILGCGTALLSLFFVKIYYQKFEQRAD